MKLKDCIEANPMFTFDLLPRETEDFDYIVDVRNEAGEVVKILQKDGIDPDEIWKTRFAIDDFILLQDISCQSAAKLVKLLEKDAHDVIRSLGKGMESGLLENWPVVAEAAVDNLRD